MKNNYLLIISIALLFVGCQQLDTEIVRQEKQLDDQEESDASSKTRGLNTLDITNERISGGSLRGPVLESGKVLYTNKEYSFSYTPTRPNHTSANSFETSIGYKKNTDPFYPISNSTTLSGVGEVGFSHTFVEPGQYKVKGNLTYSYNSGLLAKFGEIYREQEYSVRNYKEFAIVGSNSIVAVELHQFSAVNIDGSIPSNATYNWTVTSHSGVTDSFSIAGNTERIAKIRCYSPGKYTITVVVTTANESGLANFELTVKPEIKIFGPSPIMMNTVATYYIQSPPEGISVSGYSITPYSYTVTNTASDRTSIDVKFTAGGQYSLEVRCTLPDGETRTLVMSISVIDYTPIIRGENWMDFASFQIIQTYPDVVYQWEVNGNIVSPNNSQILVDRAGTAYNPSNAAYPPSGYYPDLTVQARCRASYGGITTGWCNMASVFMSGGYYW